MRARVELTDGGSAITLRGRRYGGPEAFEVPYCEEVAYAVATGALTFIGHVPEPEATAEPAPVAEPEPGVATTDTTEPTTVLTVAQVEPEPPAEGGKPKPKK